MENRDNNWAYTLYKRYPHLELPFLEAMIPQSKLEVNGICKILKRYKIDRGTRILDFSCGIGRHSIELAKRGFEVVGYDPSEFLISYAKEWHDKLKEKNKLNVQFINNQPLNVSKALSHYKFDVAIVMGNSFGFVDENFDILTLRRISKVLNPGSLIIMEVENRDWTIKNFQPYRYRQTKNIVVYETWAYDSESSIFEGGAKFYEKIHQNRRDLRVALELKIRLRLYSLHEVIKMLNQTGWSYLGSYESIQNLGPVKHQNQDIVVVAAKSKP